MGVGLTTRYFYDSYAVLAFVSGDGSYRRYFEKDDGVLTKLNLLEVYYRSLERHGRRAAAEILEAFSKFMIDFQLTDIENSMKLRLELKQKRLDLSYADALGYYLASKLKIRFLTGDKAFEGLDNVQFQE